MLRLDKKHRYIILSILTVILIYMYSINLSGNYALASILTVIIGTFLVNLPYSKLWHLLLNNLMPVHLVLGSLLALNYFPNLGLPVKILYLIFLSFGMYIVLLVNNIFLVVSEKGSIIPLYRVAVTWSQIIFVVVAIPFFAGVFKVPTYSYIQNLIVSISTFFFIAYSHWMLKFDPESKRLKNREVVSWSIAGAFIVFTAAISVSFFPTESFLRALFCSSVLMLVLNYFFNYLKNSITWKNLTENFLVTVIFFIILLTFKP